MLRHRNEIPVVDFGGVDLSESELKIDPSRFRALENIIPLGRRSLQRKPGSTLSVSDFVQTANVLAGADQVVTEALDHVVAFVSLALTATGIARLHRFQRVGQSDEVLAVIYRSGDTDVLAKWVNTNWLFLFALPATGAKYDLVTWRGKVFICDGTNAPRIYNGTTLTTLTGTNIPASPQYAVIHQDRLVLGGGPALRDAVVFSNVIDETVFGATASYNVGVGKGGEISGLAVNSITTSDKGAQTQLVVLKTDSIVLVIGTLGDASSAVHAASARVGCVSHKTIQNSSFGLIFGGNDSVYLLDQSGREPTDIGTELGDEMKTSGLLSRATGKIYNGFYHLSFPGPGSSKNNREWMLSLNPRIFPQQFNWYGPHNGDEITDYVVDSLGFYGARENTAELWKLMVDGNHFSMTDQTHARIARLISARIPNPSLRQVLFDAVGILASVVQGAQVMITTDVSSLLALGGDMLSLSGSGGESTIMLVEGSNAVTMEWDTSQWDASSWSGRRTGPVVSRPRLRGTDVQVTVTHSRNELFEIHGILLRTKTIRRQQER